MFGDKAIASRQGFSGYEPLVREICAFFLTRQPPVSAEETIEIFAFMEAADESLRRGGQQVNVEEMIARVQRPVAADSAVNEPAVIAPPATPGARR